MNAEEIKMLACLNRDMDSGKVKHVVLNGEKIAVINEAMEEFDLMNGQLINRMIFMEIIKYSIACVTAKAIIEKAKEGDMKT